MHHVQFDEVCDVDSAAVWDLEPYLQRHTGLMILLSRHDGVAICEVLSRPAKTFPESAQDDV